MIAASPAARTMPPTPPIRVDLSFVLAVALAMPTPAAAQEEVPFITTPDHVTLAMLQLARVGAGDFVLDLGSGDGRIVITAARRFGARGLGVEIVPDLVRRSREHAAAAGVADRAEFREQDLFQTDLSVASVITMYLLPEVNLQLRPALLALKPGTRIVSHDWDMGDWPPEQTVTIEVPDKAVGREKLSRVHLWTVPARVAGLWCGPRGAQLQLQQTYQTVQGALQRAGRSTPIEGRLTGAALDVTAGAPHRLQLRWLAADRLQVQAVAGRFAALKQARFTPAAGASCR